MFEPQSIGKGTLSSWCSKQEQGTVDFNPILSKAGSGSYSSLTEQISHMRHATAHICMFGGCIQKQDIHLKFVNFPDILAFDVSTNPLPDHPYIDQTLFIEIGGCRKEYKLKGLFILVLTILQQG